MAITASPIDSKDGNSRLNGPPPLPSEAKRKAPSSWMDRPSSSGDMGLGADAGSPMIQLLGISKQMEGLIQKANTLAPQQADMWATLLNAFSQATAQALAATASPQGAQPPGTGPQGPGMMAPPMPMPPMGGAPQGGQPGM